MPDPWGIVRATACAFVVAAVSGWAGERAARGERSLASLAALAAATWGVVVGLLLVPALPHVPPLSGLDRLLLIVLPVTLAIEAEVACGWLGGAWLAGERAVVALVTLPVLLHGSVWLDGGGSVVWPAILAAALFLWASWEGIEGHVESSGDRAVVAVIVAALVTAGIAIGAAGWIKGAVVALLSAAALAGALLAAGRQERTRFPAARSVAGLSGVGFMALFGMLVVGVCFGRLATTSALLIAIAPLSASVPESLARVLPESGARRVLRSTPYRVLLAAVPLAAVLAAARGDYATLERRLAAPPSRQAGAGGKVKSSAYHPSSTVVAGRGAPSAS